MAVEDHFTVGVWNRNGLPFKVGSVAQDNYDPTNGDSEITIGADLYECDTCGVAVLNVKKHAEWHDSQ